MKEKISIRGIAVLMIIFLVFLGVRTSNSQAMTLEEFVCNRWPEQQADIPLEEMDAPVIGYLSFLDDPAWYRFENGRFPLDSDIPYHFYIDVETGGWIFVWWVKSDSKTVLKKADWSQLFLDEYQMFPGELFEEVKDAPVCFPGEPAPLSIGE